MNSIINKPEKMPIPPMTKESKLDIRKIFSSISKKPTRHYFEINREERNYAAILYAALCKRGNAEVFLKKCSCEREIEDDFAIYFEYAYLRDLWKEIGDGQTANKYKKDIIRRTLDIKGVDEILELETVAINKTFGIVGQPSKTHIQYPGKWSVANLSKTFSDSNEFLKICKYKWAFNIKPDIVIHTDRDTAICIETKYESGESQYPASQAEKIIFTELKLPYIKQMQLQKYMMEDLLGIDTTFVFIGKNVRKNDDYTFMHWEEVFEDMDMADMHQSVRQMAGNPKLIS